MKNILKRIKLKKFNKNNKGVTLILAIVAIAFVGILAAAILSATATNYKLKMMDKYSKKTFYNADSVVEEVHTGLGMTCFDVLAEAYNFAAKNLTLQTSVPGTSGEFKVTQKTNDEANLQMKQKFKEILKNKIFFGNINDKDKAIEFLNTYIVDKNNARVINFSRPIDDIINYGYTFEDVTIEYMQSEGNPYYSTVTVDIAITYPNITIDFISNNDELKTYLNYCLIAMEDISIGQDEIYKGYANISGGMFAGDNGIAVHPGSSLSLLDHLTVNGVVKVPTNCVTGGDIKLMGGNSNSVMNVANSTVWCNNITLGKETSSAVLNYTNTGAKTYVADDLSLEGMNSVATVKGTYIGFGTNAQNTANKDHAATSSAIIINGRNCTLDMLGINNLVVGGRAYVDLTNNQQASTGESIALKGNQEMYLVPIAYIVSVDGVEIASNPTDSPEKMVVNLNGFFAKELGLLKDSGYTIRKDKNGKSYFYLNFKDSESQNEYIRCIVQDKYLEQCYARAGKGITQAVRLERDSIASVIGLGLARFFDKNTEIKVSQSATVNTRGTLIQVEKDVNGEATLGIIGNNGHFNEIALGQYANKYAVIKTYLALDENANYTSLDNLDITIDGATHHIDGKDSLSNIYDLCLDVDELKNLEMNIRHLEDEALTGTIAAVITTKDSSTTTTFEIPNNVNNGVVVAYGVNIKVTHDFEGLIITDKEIIVSGNANLTTGINNRAELTLDVYNDVAKYFRIFKENGVHLQVGDIPMSDVLNFSNWRKNENAYEVN